MLEIEVELMYYLQHDQVWHSRKVLVVYYCQQIAAQIAVDGSKWKQKEKIMSIAMILWSLNFHL